MGKGRWLRLLAVVLLATVVASTTYAARPPVITAKAAILVDDQTGEVLWQRNPDLPLPPASTTKIVTALLALNSGRLNERLKVTRKAAQAPPSKIRLRPGWKMRLRDLVYAVLLNSANDAAVVIAEGLSGSVPKFAKRMNATARALGATNSHFVNPNGLPAKNHYSTARDLATLFSHGMRNPLFEKIVSTKTASVSAWGTRRRIKLRNHNRLLGHYRIRVIGKTGWTIAAKKCFVGAGSANGRDIVVAVLGSHDLWGDLKRLLEFGFDGGPVPVPEGTDPDVWAAAVTASAGDSDGFSDAMEERYAVRLATFAHKTNALRLKKAVSRNGYPVRIEAIRSSGQLLYRVSVGDYSTRREARRVATQIEKTHRSLKTIVVAIG